MMDVAEDRKRWSALMKELNIAQPESGTGHSYEEGSRRTPTASDTPVLLRPSYVLGGRGMEIIYTRGAEASTWPPPSRSPRSIRCSSTKYLTHARELDVDVVCDGQDVFIGGIMEHIEEAGVHSGDATMVLPCQTIPPRSWTGWWRSPTAVSLYRSRAA